MKEEKILNNLKAIRQSLKGLEKAMSYLLEQVNTYDVNEEDDQPTFKVPKLPPPQITYLG